MTTIILYGIKNCDSVKKAKALLENEKQSFDFFDFKKQTPSDKDIMRWLTNFGAEKVINKRGTTWRTLSEQEKKLAVQSPKDQLALIKNKLMMIKRPIIETQKGTYIGFNETEIRNIL